MGAVESLEAVAQPAELWLAEAEGEKRGGKDCESQHVASSPQLRAGVDEERSDRVNAAVGEGLNVGVGEGTADEVGDAEGDRDNVGPALSVTANDTVTRTEGLGATDGESKQVVAPSPQLGASVREALVDVVVEESAGGWARPSLRGRGSLKE